jgi:alkanesulfonate monooxygenase SsuD/methylene tetrahydromethanopterin reductase-like flavin-dependent oxidoreductase (luciferase family)
MVQRAPARGGEESLYSKRAMDFGIFTMFSTREGSTQSQVFQEWLSLVQVVEDSGLDTLWLGESHFRPQRAVLASPLVGASAVAARTRRIRVGLAVQVLPLANPLRVAEEAAIVDHLSEGRLVFGVGRSSFLEAYEGYNVDYAESRALFLESLEIIRKAWIEETFSHEGNTIASTTSSSCPRPTRRHTRRSESPSRAGRRSRSPASSAFPSSFATRWTFPSCRIS